MNLFDDDEEKKEPLSSLEEENDDEFSETPYDFRAEYKERITGSLPETEEADKAFMSLRFHAIGIGILIGVLIAILASAFFFGGKYSRNKQTAQCKQCKNNPVGVRKNFKISHFCSLQ